MPNSDFDYAAFNIIIIIIIIQLSADIYFLITFPWYVARTKHEREGCGPTKLDNEFPIPRQLKLNLMNSD